MANELGGLEPVAIVLEEVEIADTVRLSGIDLDTGLRASVLIERTGMPAAAATFKQQAMGLVLTLTVQKVSG